MLGLVAYMPGHGEPSPLGPIRPSLDQALAQRREAEAQGALADAAYHEQRRELWNQFWAVVDDFLARGTQPMHTLTHAERRSEVGRFRHRVRAWTETAPLGEGWWISTHWGRSPDSDHIGGLPWQHYGTTFLLTTGDLVSGKTFSLWDVSRPLIPPESHDIELYKPVSRMRHGEKSETVLSLDIAKKLAQYL
jgi:hypothetical protein